MKLHIDIETYSSVDIKTAGAYKYCESIDFEILLVGFAFDFGPVQIVDLAQGETLPREFVIALYNPKVQKWAHNAVFERTAFKAVGYNVPAYQWFCSAVKASYCGFPLSLAGVSSAMGLEDGKLKTGNALIRYFCCPVKPTKANGMRVRNFPHHDLDKWQEFIKYCIRDVVVESEICDSTTHIQMPEVERELYILDQQINDRGVLLDLDLAKKASMISKGYSESVKQEMKILTGLDNPNSPAQLKTWLTAELGEKITTLNKEALPELIEIAGSGQAAEVLQLRKKLAKTSVKKYLSMLNCVCQDGRAHGLVQFYGAHTGRWAGRLIQTHNLPKNNIDDLAGARKHILRNSLGEVVLLYDDVLDLLSQLVRTAFVPKPGHIFAVVDYSAIEARVIAWLAGEAWRMKVFNSHGKIYEASASAMFGVPIDEVTKDQRSKGKIAELALGYQGAVGALTKMGGEKMGLSEKEMAHIVASWRKSNPAIVRLWKDVEMRAKLAVRNKDLYNLGPLCFHSDGEVLVIELPSGRRLYYREPGFTTNQWGAPSLCYKGVQTTKQWGKIDTYGGKLVENIVQAIARDLLAQSMLKLSDIVMHVHDEVVCEIPEKHAPEYLKAISQEMSEGFKWSEGLPLAAEGYLTKFYRK